MLSLKLVLKHNRLRSGELLSNDRRALDLGCIQLGLRYASIGSCELVFFWGGG